MWLCTKLGFYSIVQKRDAFHVRARCKEDLGNLCVAIGLQQAAIEEWPAADYRFRVRIFSRKEMQRLFMVLFQSITYDNFKSEVYARPDQANKRPAYNKLWQTLATLQEEELK